MTQLGLETALQNQELVDAAIKRLKKTNTVLPTFSQLQNPSTISPALIEKLRDIPVDEAHPLNLFRVHWHNDKQTGGLRDVPEYTVLPEGMSQERFDWLERWAFEKSDIIRTVGTESNVKEIYDKCTELEADERKDQRFWHGLTRLIPLWDQMIQEVNKAATSGQPEPVL